jgi:putative phosphoribosyl transferase
MGTLRILSRSHEPFLDRTEAGRLMGVALQPLGLVKPVVLGIPRGGLVVAREISKMLNGVLDIVLARKLRAPDNPELAMGAITETEKLFLDEKLASLLGVTPAYLRQETEFQMAEIDRRLHLIRGVMPKINLAGRNVIITDDGVATGATMQAALWAARQENTAKLICALPVGPEDTIIRLADSCDEMVVLRSPADFAAVGQFYHEFTQVEDSDILAILRDEANTKESYGKGS